MLIRNIVFALFLVPASLTAADFSQALSVGQAYEAIPHERTPFEANIARMDNTEVVYLDSLFDLVDAAMVERVQTQMWLQSGGSKGADQGNYSWILEQLMDLRAPSKLRDVHTLLVTAINQQRGYLDAWRESQGRDYFDVGDLRIKRVSAQIITSYQILMSLYPDAGEHNKRAFYNHLCALDFI